MKRDAKQGGFTLIELLTVVAIIALLIAILVPALSRARDTAKKVRGQALLKACGDGLEMFRNENEAELGGNNYPSSRAGDDPTDPANTSAPGKEDLCGGQWLFRYLMGLDRNGYIASKSVAQQKWGPNPYDYQIEPSGPMWYDDPSLSRCPAYMNDAPAKMPKELPGYAGDPGSTARRDNNFVFVDMYNMPVLYYASNSRYAERADANPTTFRGPPDDYQGVFNFVDNALFTGLCTESGCQAAYPPWDFGGGEHKLTYGPASWTGKNPPNWKQEIPGHGESFAYRLLSNKTIRRSGSTEQLMSVTPMRKDSFILMTPGRDGVFGTTDDVMNFGG